MLVEDWLGRLAKRYPSAAGIAVARSWAGLYDMTPDAHPVIGWVRDGVYAACGFSGHGFMQAPAVGKAVGGAPRRRIVLRPDAVPAGALLGRRDLPGDPRPLALECEAESDNSSMSNRPSIVASTSNSSVMSGSLPMSSRARGLADPGGRPRASPRHRPRPTDRSPRPTAKASAAAPRPARTRPPTRPPGSGAAPRSSSASQPGSRGRGGRSLVVRPVGRLAAVQPVEKGVSQRLAAHLQLIARPARLDLHDLHQAGLVAVTSAHTPRLRRSREA